MSKKFKIVADENMPLVAALFVDIAELTFVPGRLINQNHLNQADALLCRSITQVGQSLLEGSSVRFVGTATIGTDHLDCTWLEQQGIAWANAKGCNAAAVAQYVISAIIYWSKKQNRPLDELCIGIVGAGSVGSELARCLDLMNINYLLCDPPLQRSGDQRGLVDFEQILSCDVVSLHVPLNRGGEDNTLHLLSASQLTRLKAGQLLINASRGAVIDNLALEDYLRRPDAAAVVLDVFENEPTIGHALVQQCLLATPHIAGHSLEGKWRGSLMVYQAFCRHFGLSDLICEADFLPPPRRFGWLPEYTHNPELALLAVYPIEQDSKQLKSASPEQLTDYFDLLRKNYLKEDPQKARRDYAYCAITPAMANETIPALTAQGKTIRTQFLPSLLAR